MSAIIGSEIAAIEASSTSVDQYYLLASSGATNCFRICTPLITICIRMAVVLYYDFVITIPQEIRYIWSSKLKLMNVLIVMLRYVTVLGYVIVLVTAFAPAIVTGTTKTVSANRNFETLTNGLPHLFVPHSGSFHTLVQFYY